MMLKEKFKHMIDVKITDDQLHAMLFNFCQKQSIPKQIVSSHKFCIVAKYLEKDLNDKQNNVVIKNVKAGIAMLFKGMDLDGK